MTNVIIILFTHQLHHPQILAPSSGTRFGASPGTRYAATILHRSFFGRVVSFMWDTRISDNRSRDVNNPVLAVFKPLSIDDIFGGYPTNGKKWNHGSALQRRSKKVVPPSLLGASKAPWTIASQTIVKTYLEIYNYSGCGSMINIRTRWLLVCQCNYFSR